MYLSSKQEVERAGELEVGENTHHIPLYYGIEKTIIPNYG